MKRKVTSEERRILLDNPELVMFDPYKGFKVHHISLSKALILPAIVGVFMFLWGFLCPDFINAHPVLFASVSCVSLIVACGFLPVLYMILDDRAYKNAKETHYAQYLDQLMSLELSINVARVQHVIYEKAEGGWIMDGKEEGFGYSGYVNTFKIEPGTDLAVVYGDGFTAFVKRDPRTESLYSDKAL